MFKITNVELLGSMYTVNDSNGNLIKKIQIIPQADITDAALGEYSEDFGSYANYLQKSIEVMTGFDNVDPNRILWYATSEPEVVLINIIEFAVKHGYDKIILEHLETLED